MAKNRHHQVKYCYRCSKTEFEVPIDDHHPLPRRFYGKDRTNPTVPLCKGCHKWEEDVIRDRETRENIIGMEYRDGKQVEVLKKGKRTSTFCDGRTKQPDYVYLDLIETFCQREFQDVRNYILLIGGRIFPRREEKTRNKKPSKERRGRNVYFQRNRLCSTRDKR